ncbi:DUF3618 domain-containing protein [Amycolatopsis anabasis]|uniref:DUF3618 domain-containing protein n=1 Tax=Amycolatopsis anabasis TaxID=1840409 RepID=UPI00131D8CD1|nr:DUF3618 domain-containing protein [Amycolatopsis anabasis]
MSTEKKQDTGFPYDAEEARVDRELTRAELGDTVAELAHRVNVKEQARERKQQLTETVKHNPAPVVGGLSALAALLVLFLIWKAKR